MAVETVSTQTSQSLGRHSVWIEVRLERILKNLENLREKARPYTRVMAVVKANAYGHGLVPVAQALQGKIDFLGIGSLKEASLLREQGVTAPLFLFGRLLAEEVSIALQMNLTLTVSSWEEARTVSEAGSQFAKKGKVPVHVKVDTGMKRLGIPYESSLLEIERMAALPNIQLDGIYTHFPTAERFPDPFTSRQMNDFETLIQDLRRKGISFSFRHAANSAGTLRFKSPTLNLIRPGIALYGIYPHSSLTGEIDLEPALSLKSRIVFLKKVSPGDSVSYGREFTAPHSTTVAVLPVGYAHGYPFHLSGKGEVLHQGRRYKIAGRVCMDSMMVDLGPSANAQVGEEVTLLGPSGGEEISAEDIAALIGTIPYEIVTRLEAAIPRIYSLQSSVIGPQPEKQD